LGGDGFGNFIGCFLGVKILLGDELVFVEVLSAIIVKLGAGQISGAALGLRNRRIEGGLGGNRVSLIAGQLRLHGVHVSSRLDIFELRQHLAFFYLVTFLHVEMGDAAHGIGANVDV